MPHYHSTLAFANEATKIKVTQYPTLENLNQEINLKNDLMRKMTDHHNSLDKIVEIQKYGINLENEF